MCRNSYLIIFILKRKVISWVIQSLKTMTNLSHYPIDLIVSNAATGSNPLLLTKWLAQDLDLKSGMRVLDLGSGSGLSSIFLNKEYGVEVWAVDFSRDPSKTFKLAEECDVKSGLFPLQINARSLPFAHNYFDAIICIDSIHYFGTDDLYSSYLACFLKPGGLIGMAGAGLTHEITDIPPHLRDWWIPEIWSHHTANWWADHWRKSSALDIISTETMVNGWRKWLEWQMLTYPENQAEILALRADQGKHLGYIKVVGRRTSFTPRAGILKFSAY